MSENETPPIPSRNRLRKAAVIEQAAICFMEKGYHATSVDDVARRLGCSKGRVYHYCPTKTDLFFEVHREGMRRLFEAIEPALRTPGSSLEVLRAMLVAHAGAMLRHHHFETVVAQGVQIHRFGATTPDQRATLSELIASRDTFENLFKKQIAAARDDGHLGDVDVSIAAKVALGGLQWSIYWYRPDADRGRNARDRLAVMMADIIIDGLRARG
ncbi:MAG: TetR/AcrR family transcriptional regulator [Rhizobiaceae bacterium]|nr:TetR/AcrR family transcriptional regulator [Rhizobiaceae bacterium]MCV0408987.1 TetR/AcrR family transcriptional regulator [Rhizobiaceae bacterium]